jgi:hypothetical protein
VLQTALGLRPGCGSDRWQWTPLLPCCLCELAFAPGFRFRIGSALLRFQSQAVLGPQGFRPRVRPEARRSGPGLDLTLAPGGLALGGLALSRSVPAGLGIQGGQPKGSYHRHSER